MKIEQLKLINRLDRSVFIIERTDKDQKSITAVSNRQVMYQYLVNNYMSEKKPCYIWMKTNRPVVLTTYNQLVKMLAEHSSIKIFIVDAPGKHINYTLHKLPLFREL